MCEPKFPIECFWIFTVTAMTGRFMQHDRSSIRSTHIANKFYVKYFKPPTSCACPVSINGIIVGFQSTWPSPPIHKMNSSLQWFWFCGIFESREMLHSCIGSRIPFLRPFAHRHSRIEGERQSFWKHCSIYFRVSHFEPIPDWCSARACICKIRIELKVIFDDCRFQLIFFPSNQFIFNFHIGACIRSLNYVRQIKFLPFNFAARHKLIKWIQMKEWNSQNKSDLWRWKCNIRTHFVGCGIVWNHSMN